MQVTGPTAFFGAISGFLAVAFGAFASHALQDPQAKAWAATGFQYHMMHTMAAFAALSFRNWGATRARFAPPFFFIGIIIFSGSLYALALGAPRSLGLITPIGGISFLIGWAILAWSGWQLFRAARKESKSP
jgi:uncharacterized membrane protein YgdD (TMEM256/DUF423 family)